MIAWQNVQSVFLDMDGTLLDLHFDNHFWREFVPQNYAVARGLSLQSAKDELFPKFRKAEGTMDWYCVDYWSRELDLDIANLKRELRHMIAVLPHVMDFLDQVRQSGRRLVLVTNAHPKSLLIKMEQTQLAGHLDDLISTHNFGLPKENPVFWQRLHKKEDYDPDNTLLVDDSLPVLESAQNHGIRYLVAITRPDSRQPERSIKHFPAIKDFRELMPPES